ncbi:hypothetical protein [Streptomyces griseoloalbus]|uniref:hypothetical protein n=1 Tax=Streptomyces griseoloalbus TaxID=67303 RepID=UPI0018749C66
MTTTVTTAGNRRTRRTGAALPGAALPLTTGAGGRRDGFRLRQRHGATAGPRPAARPGRLSRPRA